MDGVLRLCLGCAPDDTEFKPDAFYHWLVVETEPCPDCGCNKAMEVSEVPIH